MSEQKWVSNSRCAGLIDRHTLAKLSIFFEVVPIAFYEAVLTFTSIKLPTEMGQYF